MANKLANLQLSQTTPTDKTGVFKDLNDLVNIPKSAGKLALIAKLEEAVSILKEVEAPVLKAELNFKRPTDGTFSLKADIKLAEEDTKPAKEARASVKKVAVKTKPKEKKVIAEKKPLGRPKKTTLNVTKAAKKK